jgi:nucleolar GTP-binding protein
LAKEANAYIIQMSNLTKDGIEDVKSKACDILLDHRLTQKAKDPKKAEAILNRLHIAEPKKRDNVDRPAIVPDSVKQGVKKVGPTIKELQEEYGGAGAFHIPVEEHYQLEKEEWRYDKYPEFYNGSNVMDFYDPDITEKLKALEEEEEELLRMEGATDELLKDEVIDGIATSELKESLKFVRGKKTLLKQEHKLKAKNTKFLRSHAMSDVIEHFESKGVEINKDSLRSHSRVRRTIKDLEGAKDALAKKALDSDDGSDIVSDEEMAGREADARGRKRRRSTSPGKLEMDVDEENGVAKKSGRTLTPAQRHISA